MHSKPPVRGQSVYAVGWPTRVPVEVICRIFEMMEDWDNVEDATVTDVVTGYGSYTTHHLDDSDYIVQLSVRYDDRPNRTYEACYGILQGQPELWYS